MGRTTEDARALLRTAQGITRQTSRATDVHVRNAPAPASGGAERIGIRPGSRHYDEVIAELEYEAAMEWDESAQYAREDRRHAITERGLEMLRESG